MFRIKITFFYKQVINKKFKVQNKKKTLLKTLTIKFKKFTNVKTKKLKKNEIVHRNIVIKVAEYFNIKKQNKNKTKHNVIQFNKKSNHQIIYINKNCINQKIKVLIVDVNKCIILKFFFERFIHYTIYSTKLRNIELILILTIKQKQLIHIIKKIIIFTNNQTIIRFLINLSKRSNLTFVKNIIKLIKRLRNYQIIINFQ